MIVANDTLRRGLMGTSYADTLRVQDAAAPVTWRVTSGALPVGLALSSSGVISGIPENSGTYEFAVRAEGGGRLALKAFRLVIGRPVVDPQAAARQVIGVANSLAPELGRFLDLQGNRNGQLDVGDLLLYLRDRAVTPANAGRQR